MNDDHAAPNATPYAGLTPDVILDALSAMGLQPTGRFIALNSYENRVYQVELEAAGYSVVKFYRAGRWSDATILEEHGFALELAAQGIALIPPQVIGTQTLHVHAGFRYALYPRRGGRPPELEHAQVQEQLGRMLGRLHAVGRLQRFEHRPVLTVNNYARAALEVIQASGFVPGHVQHNYFQVAEALLRSIADRFEAIGAGTLRLHGDCHPGNILWTDAGPHMVDLDDCCTGPAMQDLWMLLSGTRDEMTKQLRTILDGYETFTDFDYSELRLIEAMRGLRLLHYSGWLTRRWQDPAFPLHFPWFNTARYWEEQVMILREQVETLENDLVLRV
ncbi:MAG: serine/threonine protein kinase [Gammaproteobacteria bacterium]|nr:serine/threonine protein kinase [Gammaproteobacteria bacterium]